MPENINWKERYQDLEKQMYDMLLMVSNQFESKSKLSIVNNDSTTEAKIVKMLFVRIDSALDVIVISNAISPMYSFELIDNLSNKPLIRSGETRKNSYRFNDIDRISEFRIKAKIRNNKSKIYSDTSTSRIFNN